MDPSAEKAFAAQARLGTASGGHHEIPLAVRQGIKTKKKSPVQDA